MDSRQLYQLYQQHPTVTTDSRNCPEGSIFIALRGASFDGNLFADAALDKGCAYVVIDNKEYYKDDGRHILVDDCLTTFKELAREHRRQFDIPVIGITGTNGKTTTKQLTAAVLQQKYNVLYTQGNFNNDIGVPKTLLRLRPEHEIAVVEMGASHPGDIKALVDVVEPDYAIITNVGRAHLQGFGSFEGVIHTKGELYDFMRANHGLGNTDNGKTLREGKAPQSCVFIDSENPYLNGIAEGLNLVRYGCKDDDQLWVSGHVDSCSPMLNFTWRHNDGATLGAPHATQTHLIGEYNITNMLAAVSIGLYFGVPADNIVKALSAYVPSNNRSQFEQTADNRLIVDAYNANPTSMAAALRNFADIDAKGKMVIVGDMKELGEVSHDEHQRIVDQLRQMTLDQVWLVGSEFEGCDTPSGFRLFDNVEKVKEAIAAAKPHGKYILIKGSNGTRLFQLPELL